MQARVDKGDDVEAIAAHHFTTPAVVRQRLKLAAVSPQLHDIYADDGMTLDQLMAFTVADDPQRQEELWAQLDHSFNKSPGLIRPTLPEDSVRVPDKRAALVGVDTYVTPGRAEVGHLFRAAAGGE